MAHDSWFSIWLGCHIYVLSMCTCVGGVLILVYMPRPEESQVSSLALHLLSLKSIFLLFIYVCVSVCDCPQNSNEVIGFSGARVSGCSCWGLRLTAEISLTLSTLASQVTQNCLASQRVLQAACLHSLGGVLGWQGGGTPVRPVRGSGVWTLAFTEWQGKQFTPWTILSSSRPLFQTSVFRGRDKDTQLSDTVLVEGPTLKG